VPRDEDQPRSLDTVLTGYDRLVQVVRHRPTRVKGRSLEEEADADRGRVLFCPAFRRLQNKAQVFPLERNAAIRSRLTHSLEVSSIGRYVTQQALKAFPPEDLDTLRISGKKRAIITLVETACLLHDIGNPPFGHFGEFAIADWFHRREDKVKPKDIGGQIETVWYRYFKDLTHFDGNPQGFRIVTKLQLKEHGDLSGMNLTASTLAASLKYPWSSDYIGTGDPRTHRPRKKAGHFHTEASIANWVWQTLELPAQTRHPLVYLMEAADDIAYCISDIEDGLEKGLLSARQVAQGIKAMIAVLTLTEPTTTEDTYDLEEMGRALCDLEGVPHEDNADGVRRFSGMEDFRASLLRFLARHAGIQYRESHEAMLSGSAPPILRSGKCESLLNAVREFAETHLYRAPLVRDRELTSHAVLQGLLEAYLPLMECERDRFERALKGDPQDGGGRRITGEQGLAGRLPEKYVTVYREEVRLSDREHEAETGMRTVLERIHRLHLVVDYISGMTDEFALQTFRLLSGMEVARAGQ